MHSPATSTKFIVVGIYCRNYELVYVKHILIHSLTSHSVNNALVTLASKHFCMKKLAVRRKRASSLNSAVKLTSPSGKEKNKFYIKSWDFI